MRRLALTVAIFASLATQAWADYDAGYAAFKRGDYFVTMREWNSLEEQGNSVLRAFPFRLHDAGNLVPEDDSEPPRSYQVAAAHKVLVEPAITFKGKFYALLIAIEDYEFLPRLRPPLNNAKALAAVLKKRYRFEDDAVKLLLDASRREILDELARLRRELGPDDRLLLYYAGHGQIDPATDQGYWQPADAEPDVESTWIWNDAIKRNLKSMAERSAKHVLVIAETTSGASLGWLWRGVSRPKRDEYFETIDSYVSRHVISSGAEPVTDHGIDGLSIFAYFLVKALQENQEPYLTSRQLFARLVRNVANNSHQTPEHGVIPDSGDEDSGDFTFILRSGLTPRP